MTTPYHDRLEGASDELRFRHRRAYSCHSLAPVAARRAGGRLANVAASSGGNNRGFRLTAAVTACRTPAGAGARRSRRTRPGATATRWIASPSTATNYQVRIGSRVLLGAPTTYSAANDRITTTINGPQPLVADGVLLILPTTLGNSADDLELRVNHDGGETMSPCRFAPSTAIRSPSPTLSRDRRSRYSA